jgi:predicted Fe-Mo cluster-binding NifX family protein
MGTEHVQLAFVTDDGSTISSHFGRALYYEVLTLQEGKIVDRKRINKDHHQSHGPDEAGHHHGEKHAAMTAPLAGVAVLVARGMGVGARQHLEDSGIRPILTDLHTIEEAVDHYVAGTLRDNPRRLHHHLSPRLNKQDRP